MLDHGDKVTSPGGSFAYTVQGPVCVLFDREELPWPSCSLSWKGKQPSWNRIGRRFVPDLACEKCHSYAVSGMDIWGSVWTQVLTMYHERLSRQEKAWWYWKYVPNQKPPNYVGL